MITSQSTLTFCRKQKPHLPEDVSIEVSFPPVLPPPHHSPSADHLHKVGSRALL